MIYLINNITGVDILPYKIQNSVKRQLKNYNIDIEHNKESWGDSYQFYVLHIHGEHAKLFHEKELMEMGNIKKTWAKEMLAIYEDGYREGMEAYCG